MEASRSYSSMRDWIATLALIGGGMGFGYLTQGVGPNWHRWLLIAALQAALALAADLLPGFRRRSPGRLALKMALWPAVGAGLAGIARPAGLDLYGRVEWLSV